MKRNASMYIQIHHPISMSQAKARSSSKVNPELNDVCDNYFATTLYNQLA